VIIQDNTKLGRLRNACVVHKVVLGIKMTCETAKNMTLTKSSEITLVVYRMDEVVVGPRNKSWIDSCCWVVSSIA